MFNEVRFINDNFEAIRNNAKDRKSKEKSTVSVQITNEAKDAIFQYADGLQVDKSDIIRHLLYAGWLYLKQEVENA